MTEPGLDALGSELLLRGFLDSLTGFLDLLASRLDGFAGRGGRVGGHVASNLGGILGRLGDGLASVLGGHNGAFDHGGAGVYSSLTRGSSGFDRGVSSRTGGGSSLGSGFLGLVGLLLRTTGDGERGDGGSQSNLRVHDRYPKIA